MNSQDSLFAHDSDCGIYKYNDNDHDDNNDEHNNAQDAQYYDITKDYNYNDSDCDCDDDGEEKDDDEYYDKKNTMIDFWKQFTLLRDLVNILLLLIKQENGQKNSASNLNWSMYEKTKEYAE